MIGPIAQQPQLGTTGLSSRGGSESHLCKSQVLTFNSQGSPKILRRESSKSSRVVALVKPVTSQVIRNSDGVTQLPLLASLKTVFVKSGVSFSTLRKTVAACSHLIKNKPPQWTIMESGITRVTPRHWLWKLPNSLQWTNKPRKIGQI